MKTYYLVMVDGIPEGVSANYQAAKQTMLQLSSKNRVATILPVTPLQMEFDFIEEADTDPCCKETCGCG
jgi:hypothetical protein